MDNNNDVSQLAREVAVLKERLIAVQEARDLQAREYERRLEELNHAHQQQTERNAHYVSREAWDIYNQRLEDWRHDVDRWRWVSIGAGGMIGGIIAFIMRLIR